MTRPAVFLDRDGTIIRHVHYLRDPELVELLPGSASAIRTFREAGFAVVMVSNQSALGRGLLDASQLEAVNAELIRQLEAGGATLDGMYWCPIVPECDDRTVIEHRRRKPGPGMLEEAASELELDLASSWMVGDMISDVLAGRHAGCRGSLLIASGAGDDEAAAEADAVVPDLEAAAGFILQAVDSNESTPRTIAGNGGPKS